MTESEVRNLLATTYLTEFSGDFPIAIDNLKFDPPNPKTKWVRFGVQFNNGYQESLGRKTNRRFTGSGFVVMQVFTPINKATNENDILAYNSKVLFDGEHIEQVRLFNGRTSTIGSDGEWYQQNVVIEFEYEDIR